MEVDIKFVKDGDDEYEDGAVYTINLSDIPSNVEKIIVKSYYS